MVRRLGQEEVLHDEVLELGERLAGMARVRIRHGRVLAHDVHTPDLARVHGVHDLDDGQAAHRVERSAPDVLEARADVIDLYGLVVGEHHGYESGVRSTLNVVLAAQGMQSRAGSTHLSRDHRQRDETACVVRTVDVLGDTHAPEDDACRGGGVSAGHGAQRAGIDTADRRHRLGGERLYVPPETVEPLRVRRHVLPIVELLGNDDVEQRVQQRHVRAGLELKHVGSVAPQRLPTRVHHHQRLALLRGLLEERRGDRVVLGRVGADDDDDVGIGAGRERRRDRARADALQQRRHGGGVAQPRAVIDVVGAESGAHQLLHQVRFLVRALGGTEAGQRGPAIAVADARKSARRPLERFLPAGLAEVRQRIAGVDLSVAALGRILASHQRAGKAMGMAHVVKAETTLDAEPVAVGRPVASLYRDDGVVLELVGDLAADAAVRADAVHLVADIRPAVAVGVDERGLHQCTRGAGLHALAAGDAGARPHGVVDVEHHLGAVSPVGHADDVVHLHLAAGAHAQRAVDAGIEVHAHGRVARVHRRRTARRKAARRDPGPLGPLPETGVALMGRLPRRLVGEQHLDHHAARASGALGVRPDRHPRARSAQARRRQHALALDLHHAGAAVPVGAVAGRIGVAQMGNVDALTLRDLPDGLVGPGMDVPAVEAERDRRLPQHDWSSAKYLSTDSSGLAAACPSPQMEASAMA